MLLLLLLPGFNGRQIKLNLKIIIMRENEIHICKGKEDKVEKIERKERERVRRAIVEL